MNNQPEKYSFASQIEEYELDIEQQKDMVAEVLATVDNYKKNSYGGLNTDDYAGLMHNLRMKISKFINDTLKRKSSNLELLDLGITSVQAQKILEEMIGFISSTVNIQIARVYCDNTLPSTLIRLRYGRSYNLLGVEFPDEKSFKFMTLPAALLFAKDVDEYLADSKRIIENRLKANESREKLNKPKVNAKRKLSRALNIIDIDLESLEDSLFSSSGTPFYVEKFNEAFSQKDFAFNGFDNYPMNALNAFIQFARVSNKEVYVDDIIRVLIEPIEDLYHSEKSDPTENPELGVKLLHDAFAEQRISQLKAYHASYASLLDSFAPKKNTVK